MIPRNLLHDTSLSQNWKRRRGPSWQGSPASKGISVLVTLFSPSILGNKYFHFERWFWWNLNTSFRFELQFKASPPEGRDIDVNFCLLALDSSRNQPLKESRRSVDEESITSSKRAKWELEHSGETVRSTRSGSQLSSSHWFQIIPIRLATFCGVSRLLTAISLPTKRRVQVEKLTFEFERVFTP